MAWGKNGLVIGGTSAEITTLLRAWSAGDEAALGRLAERVYPELRLMARRYIKTSGPGNTLQGTALVHEVYLRLVDVTQVELRERAQFFQLFTLAAPGFQNGKPFAADFNGDGLADMAAYNPNTGKVTIVYMALGNQAMGTLTQNMAGKAMPVAADFSGDFQADMATYTMSTAHWALDSQMNNPNLHPVLSFAFGTPPSDVPVMTIPSVLW